MQEVEAVSDRIIIIDKGKLVTNHKVSEMEMSTAQSVIVEFDSEVELDVLSAISEIQEVEALGGNSYRLIGKSDNDLRKIVSIWAQQSRFLVLTLKQEDHNLEEFFRKHTS
jgi:ABC-2 type transport system ATP-binding protein